MKKSQLYVTLLSAVLLLSGFGCAKKQESPLSVPPVPQPEQTVEGIVPPPPEVIADIRQEGYSNDDRQYYDIIQESPNQDVDLFQAELGL